MVGLRQVTAWLNGLTVRRRVAVCLAALGVIVIAWYVLLMAPLLHQKRYLTDEVAQRQRQIADTDSHIQALQRGRAQSPAARKRAQLAALRFDIDKLDRRIKQMAGEMIGPRRMRRVLQSILTRNADLTLISIESLAPKPLVNAAQKADGGTAVTHVYMHGVRIKFKGGYLATLRYVKALEKLPWRFFWGGIEYDVKDYPEAYGTLDVYTLSMKEGWIGV